MNISGLKNIFLMILFKASCDYVIIREKFQTIYH